MYRLTEEQIDYILDDIRRGGIVLEDLQSNLLDHICCILERDLREGDDFEVAYRRTIRQFYHSELSEIERETIHLSNNKNHYTMKKIMLASGIISVAAFALGSFFKIMYWPGAGTLLLTGMALLTVVFLPLFGILKIQQSGSTEEKVVFATGVLTAMLYVLSNFFAIQHLEGRTTLWLATVASAVFVFLPAYLYYGLRKADKLNTMAVAILVAGLAGSLFTMIRVH